MMARWPGHIKPGRVSELLCYFPDFLPTACELAGVKTPSDIDGISIVPELIGAKAAGRSQPQHEYLYWEIGQQTAVRMHDWKGYRGSPRMDWQLFDLSKDISETTDVSAANMVIINKLIDFATAAHTPAVEGTFASTDLHERDRKAKWGDKTSPPRGKPRKARNLKKARLISKDKWRVARVSSESVGNKKFAKNAFDGDPTTIWHTRFSGEIAKHPHELVINLGATHSIRGIRYLARQDGGWNGAIGKCEVYIGGSADGFDKPVATTAFKKVRESQEVEFDRVEGRFCADSGTFGSQQRAMGIDRGTRHHREVAPPICLINGRSCCPVMTYTCGQSVFVNHGVWFAGHGSLRSRSNIEFDVRSPNVFVFFLCVNDDRDTALGFLFP